MKIPPPQKRTNFHATILTIIISSTFTVFIFGVWVYVKFKNTPQQTISVKKIEKEIDTKYIPLIEDALHYSFKYPAYWRYEIKPDDYFKPVTFYEGSQRILTVESPIAGKGLHGLQRIETKYYQTNDPQKILTYYFYKSTDKDKGDAILVYWGATEKDEGLMQFSLHTNPIQKEQLIKIIDNIISSFIFIDKAK